MRKLFVLAFVFFMMVGCKRCQECQCDTVIPNNDNYIVTRVCRDDFRTNKEYKNTIKKIETLGADTAYTIDPNGNIIGFTNYSCECKADILW